MLATENCTDGTVSLHGVEVRIPAGDLLVNPLDLHLDPGDTMVITGRSGSGQTTLMRSLAQLWPYTTMGNICSSATASGGWAARRVTGPSPCEPRAVS
jgi:ABC-type uncharacterized transport system fused permease/ATPase subunit